MRSAPLAETIVHARRVAGIFGVDPDLLEREARRTFARRKEFDRFVRIWLNRMAQGLGMSYNARMSARGGQPPKSRRTKRGGKRLL